MEAKEIIEAKIAISEFMEVKFAPYKGNHSYDVKLSYSECLEFIKEHKLDGYTPHFFWQKELPDYDSSWEHLMPVIGKISKIKCLDNELEIDTYYCRTFGMVDLEDEYMVRINRFTLHSSPKFILAAFYAVVEFVTWYKQNKKS